MSDWTGSFWPLPRNPGPLEPAPTPVTPGWTDWLRAQVPEQGDWGERLRSVGMEIISRERDLVAIEGDNPGPWYPDRNIAVGEGDAYRDFTRFRRDYPSITYQPCWLYQIRVFAVYDKGTTMTIGVYPFWVPDGSPVTQTNFSIHRWERTSGVTRLPDGTPARYNDLTAPRSWHHQREPAAADMDPPTDLPPSQLLSIGLGVPEQRRGSQVAVAKAIPAEQASRATWADLEALARAGWRVGVERPAATAKHPPRPKAKKR